MCWRVWGTSVLVGRLRQYLHARTVLRETGNRRRTEFLLTGTVLVLVLKMTVMDMDRKVVEWVGVDMEVAVMTIAG